MILKINEIFKYIDNDPGKKIYLCYVNDYKKFGFVLNENIFENNDISTDKNYFFVSSEKIDKDGVFCRESNISSIRYAFKPKLKKGYNLNYGKDVIIKISFFEDNYHKNLNEIIEKSFYYIDGKIRISKLKNESTIFLYFEKVKFLLGIIEIIDEKAKMRLLDYKIFKEFLFNKKIKGKVFVPEGYKPYIYEFIYNHPGAISIIDEKEYLHTFLKSKNFKEVYNFLEVSLKNKPIVFSDNVVGDKFEVFIDVIKDRNYFIPIEEIKQKEMHLKRELRRLEKMKREIFSDKIKMSGIFLKSDELNDWYYYFLLNESEVLKKIKVYKFLKKDEFDTYTTHYLFYGPEYLMPVNNYNSFIEDINWSTEKLRILIPRSHKIIPEIQIENYPELFERFINSIFNKVDKERIEKNKVFLIIDNTKKYFGTFSVLVYEKNGMTLKEFFKNYAELKLPVSSGKDYYSINESNVIEKSNYYLNVKDEMDKFFKNIIDDVQYESENAINAWYESIKNIKLEYNEINKKIMLFKNDINLLKRKLNLYFSDKSVLNLLNDIYKNIKDFHSDLNDMFNEKLILDVNEKYDNYKKGYEDTIIRFEEIFGSIEKDYNAYLKKFDNIKNNFKDLEKELDKQMKSLEEFYNKYLSKYKKEDEYVKED
ncbi:hypothetical protein [Marinitoga sp. 1155]|uniref:hypothetical protein n=1 Tax=Marinitoga sp. 1155 TaxID=1428448 RepID=UPI0006414705|nr:hypothetical protein [Marinitoga sp. 1155]KLO23521.1 hypothetical protein X274_06450 [Marinitoga sp. 1155]